MCLWSSRRQTSPCLCASLLIKQLQYIALFLNTDNYLGVVTRAFRGDHMLSALEIFSLDDNLIIIIITIIIIIIIIKSVLRKNFLSLVEAKIHQKFVFLAKVGSKCKILFSGPLKGTSLHDTTSFDVLIVNIGSSA